MTDQEANDTMIKLTDLLFNKVDKQVVVEKPIMVNEGIYTNQEKTIDPDHLKLNHVLFLGAGSVGSHSIFQLNRMGVSSFTLFDYDVVEPHNSASAIYGYEALMKQSDNYRKARMGRDRFSNSIVAIDHYATNSPFKVDKMYEIIKDHDPQSNVELFKTGYGYNMRETMDVFAKGLEKYNMPFVYSRRDGRVKNDWEYNVPSHFNRITTNNLMKYTDPNIAVLTVDTAIGRLNSLSILRSKINSKVFPIIDACVDSSLHGQVFCFDIFNDEDCLSWINTMFSEDNQYSDMDTFTYDYKNGLLANNIINFENEVICGDKMSIISGTQSATIISGLFAELFRDGQKPNFDTVPKMYNWSFIGKYYNPHMNTQKNIVS